MALTEEQENALRDLKSAMDAIKRCPSGKTGETAEAKYGEVYKKCYRLGLFQYPLRICKTTAWWLDVGIVDKNYMRSHKKT